jgi:hypothetical protein
MTMVDATTTADAFLWVLASAALRAASKKRLH